jgi:hypothetical protein
VTSATTILVDAFGRVNDSMRTLLPGIEPTALLWQPDHAANSIGWLAWHLSRVQDDHLAGVGQIEQVWTEQGFADRFALPYPVTSIGYGQSEPDVAQFNVADSALLLEYHDAVHAQTLEVLSRLDDTGYARIVDERWDPPVTAAVRLVSVIEDTLMHLGQIGYLRGLFERR